MQPCKVLQTLDMFDEVERRSHKQASKAALRVLAIQQQQLLWAAKSKGDKEGIMPAMLSGIAAPSLS